MAKISIDDNLLKFIDPTPITINNQQLYIVPYYSGSKEPKTDYDKIMHLAGFMLVNTPKRKCVVAQGFVNGDSTIVAQILIDRSKMFNYAEVQYLYVKETMRKHGLGGTLLKHGLMFLDKLGIDNVTLEAIPHMVDYNLNGTKVPVDINYFLYRKYGFSLGILATKGILKRYNDQLTPMLMDLKKCDPSCLPISLTITPANIDEFSAETVKHGAEQALKPLKPKK